jgi:phosphatidyl-myo-inositol alpha-mannosyltransferase
MKIALVSPYTWTTPGGVNSHIASLAAQLRARGHETRILAPADGPVEPGVVPLGGTIGVPFNGAIARLAFGPRVVGRVRVALRRADPDLLHVHEPFTLSTSMLASMSASVPIVATFHAAVDSRIYRASRPLLSPLWRKFKVKIAVSEAARATVEHIFGSGVRIIPNGVDTRLFKDTGPAPPRSKDVLFFGRLEERKGAHVLIEALPALFTKVPGARVTIAGDGPERKKLEAAVPEHLRTAVSFTGHFDDTSRLALLASANVVALPALGGESFGITLLEAMAAGRAVIATSIPGYAAVARDGIDGILVPPGDAAKLAEALIALLRDRPRALKMGKAARQRAQVFDWPAIGAQIEEVYREALAQDPPKGRRARRAR